MIGNGRVGGDSSVQAATHPTRSTRHEISGAPSTRGVEPPTHVLQQQWQSPPQRRFQRRCRAVGAGLVHDKRSLRSLSALVAPHYRSTTNTFTFTITCTPPRHASACSCEINSCSASAASAPSCILYCDARNARWRGLSLSLQTLLPAIFPLPDCLVPIALLVGSRRLLPTRPTAAQEFGYAARIH